MTAPEKIWINPSIDLPKLNGCIDKNSVEYIRKDVFIEKAKKWFNSKNGIVITDTKAFFEEFIDYMGQGKVDALNNTLPFLDALEVKEVDLEKEWKEYFKYRGDVATVNLKHLAKHFFELGLKAQKGD